MAKQAVLDLLLITFFVSGIIAQAVRWRISRQLRRINIEEWRRVFKPACFRASGLKWFEWRFGSFAFSRNVRDPEGQLSRFTRIYRIAFGLSLGSFILLVLWALLPAIFHE